MLDNKRAEKNVRLSRYTNFYFLYFLYFNSPSKASATARSTPLSCASSAKKEFVEFEFAAAVSDLLKPGGRSKVGLRVVVTAAGIFRSWCEVDGKPSLSI